MKKDESGLQCFCFECSGMCKRMFSPVNGAELLLIFHSMTSDDFQKVTRLLQAVARQSYSDLWANVTCEDRHSVLRGEWSVHLSSWRT